MTSIVDLCARATHEIVRAYSAALGDRTQLPWEEAPEWQRESAMDGALAVLEGASVSPAESHANWMREKERQGWRWGPQKDAITKQHPCMVPFEELPTEQRAKDHLFVAVVLEVARVVDEAREA